MANLRRPSSKDKDIIVGRFNNLDGRCKKHPKHRQSPGICSLCLKDKLSQLSSPAAASSSSSQRAPSDSSCASSLSSSSSSSSVSSCASPHRRPINRPDPSFSIFLVSGNKQGGLFKSKSMAVFPRTRRRDTNEGGVDHHSDNKKSDKKNGFWFKLLHPKKSKRMEEKKVVRSSSLRETLTVRS